MITRLNQDDEGRLFKRLNADHDGEIAPMLAEAREMGITLAENRRKGRHTCRICGCWELQACEGGCSWVEDDLCSACDTIPSAGDRAQPRKGDAHANGKR